MRVDKRETRGNFGKKEEEGSEKLEEESYEFGRDRIASCNINKVLRGFPLDHKGNGIGLFGR